MAANKTVINYSHTSENRVLHIGWRRGAHILYIEKEMESTYHRLATNSNRVMSNVIFHTHLLHTFYID